MKLLALLVAVAAGALIVWMAAAHALAGGPVRFGSGAWPGDVPREFRDREENESATRLLATAERFDLRGTRGPMNDYIRSELTKSGDAVAPPPEPVASFLDRHGNTIRTLRAQVVSNQPPVWALQVDDLLDPPMPPLGLHMQLFTILTADALAQHSRGSEAAAWSDLHATWILSRSLWLRPEPPSIMGALVGTRMVAAVATKLPNPVPRWLEAVLQFEIMPPLVRALEYAAWLEREKADRYAAGEPDDDSRFDVALRRIAAPVLKPIRVAHAAVLVGRLRETAAAARSADPCEPFVRSDAQEWAAVVRRFNRFRIEREGVAKLLILRATGTFSPASTCRSGRWSYDGKTLAFHGMAPPQSSRVTIIPLAFGVRRLAAAFDSQHDRVTERR